MTVNTHHHDQQRPADAGPEELSGVIMLVSLVLLLGLVAVLYI
jgi:hypothetical protein